MVLWWLRANGCLYKVNTEELEKILFCHSALLHEVAKCSVTDISCVAGQSKNPL